MSDDVQKPHSPPEPAPSALDAFLGGSPLQIAFKLLILSLIVGFFLAALDLSPLMLIYWLRSAFEHILDLGFYALHDVLRWIGLGAVIVVPIFIIFRLLSSRSGSK